MGAGAASVLRRTYKTWDHDLDGAVTVPEFRDGLVSTSESGVPITSSLNVDHVSTMLTTSAQCRSRQHNVDHVSTMSITSSQCPRALLRSRQTELKLLPFVPGAQTALNTLLAREAGGEPLTTAQLEALVAHAGRR